MRSLFLLCLLAGLSLAGCVTTTVRDVTLPASRAAHYAFATWTVTPPTEEAWRLVSRNVMYSYATFYQADDKAILSAFWYPVFRHDKPEDARTLAERLWKENVVKDFKLSPDFQIEKEKESGIESIGGRDYHRWQMQLISIEKTKRTTNTVVALIHAAPSAPDLYVFLLAVPDVAGKHLADHEQTLRAMAAGSEPKSYKPSDVALARLVLAAEIFFDLAEKETGQRDADRLRASREDALTEADDAIRELPSAPQPLTVLGRIIEYNAESLRYGEGFDAARAEDCFRKAIERRPSFLLAREELAKLYEVLDRVTDAEREWKLAVDTEPSNWECHYKLGRFYQKQGRTTDALASFREALRFWRGAELTRQELEKEMSNLSKKSSE